ncbi:MAG: redoxin family protein [Dysgonamonadaceae bacterium]|jgi:thiol-disulfide isomerase/thioredoxin|nr:redoxin family protein [Dysgonamonadaceae bacterium]
MKTKQRIGVGIVLLLTVLGCTNNRGVVERPAFIARNTDALEIDKVELSDTATILYIKAFYAPHNWIRIDPNSFLLDEEGKQYPIRSTEGMELGKEFYMPDSGESEFTMTFSPVPSHVAAVDFSEGDFEGAFKIWGIQLTNKPLKIDVPKRLQGASVDKKAVLPPVTLQSGTARLQGQILGYRSGMPAEVSVRVTYPFDYSPVGLTFPVDEKGKFSGEIDALSVHPVTVYWAGSPVRCYVAPGETTSLVLNPAESSRQNSRLADKSRSLGEPVYYDGYLASLSKELAGLQSAFPSGRMDDFESFLAFLQIIGTKTPDELKTFFLDEYRAKKAALDTLDASPACKQILQCAFDWSYASDILNISAWIDRAYIFNNQLQNDMKKVEQYYATRKFNVSDDFYDALKDFSYLNDPTLLYTSEAAESIYEWQAVKKQALLSRILGTDQGPLFDLMQASGAYTNIKEFKALDEAQIEQLPADVRDFIEKKNNELLQLIEANKKKTGFTVNDIAEVPNADVFPSILSKFRGKPILLDVWATWCGPCRLANEELKPVKAELSGKDLVYVFVAGENSPLETWKNMIPDLHGEHFRLTAKQWDYIGNTFGIRGVPTYFFIDREGNIKEKLTGYPGIQQMKEKIFQLLDE